MLLYCIMATIRNKKKYLTTRKKKNMVKKRKSSLRKTRRYTGGQSRQRCIDACNLKYDNSTSKPKLKPKPKPKPPRRTGHNYGYMKLPENSAQSNLPEPLIF